MQMSLSLCMLKEWWGEEEEEEERSGGHSELRMSSRAPHSF